MNDRERSDSMNGLAAAARRLSVLRWRRGLLRVWLLATGVWLLYVGMEHEDEIAYATTYVFARGSLERAETVRRDAVIGCLRAEIAQAAEKNWDATPFECASNRAVRAYLGKSTKDDAIAELRQLEAAPSIVREPRLDWLFLAVVPPVAVPFAIWAVFLTARWMANGFLPR